MRVFLTTDNLGGVWTFSVELARELRDHHTDVFLAITGKPLTDAQREELRGIPYYFAPFKQEWMDDPWEDIDRAGEWLMQLAGQLKPHVVHLNSYSWGNLTWNAPVVMTLHSCVLSWWNAVKKCHAPYEWDTYRERITAGIRAAGVLTAPSRAMLDTAAGLYGPFSRSKVIYNGMDPNLFKSGHKQKIVFSMGRLWDEAKNIRLLIDAAPMIPYPIVIAGEKPANDAAGIPGNVQFTGVLDRHQVAAWLSKAAVYALPVRYEPFGYTFLEAAFSGCALVGGDIPSLREIWSDAMIYVDPDDPENLARSVNKLLEQHEERENYAVAAKGRAGRYQRGLMLRRYKDLYQEVQCCQTQGIRDSVEKLKLIRKS